MDNKVTTFSDILKQSFLNSSAEAGHSIFDITISMAIVLFLSVIICKVYKYTFQGVLYSKSFNTSLVGLSTVTCLIIMTITSNIVLSLGMVGALSIVRFRTAIKDPIDIVFMFWSISVGIASGAGFYTVAVYGSLLIAVILLVLNNMRVYNDPYLLIINANDVTKEEHIEGLIQTYSDKFKIKSKIVSSDSVEFIYEIRLKSESKHLLGSLKEFEGVESLNLVSYNGDYTV